MIAKTPQVTDLVADRKSDVALLPSFNALGNGKSVVECEDLFVAPLASAKFREAFITEVTPPAAIASKTVKFWVHVSEALENRKIPQEMAVPQHTGGRICNFICLVEIMLEIQI